LKKPQEAVTNPKPSMKNSPEKSKASSTRGSKVPEKKRNTIMSKRIACKAAKNTAKEDELSQRCDLLETLVQNLQKDIGYLKSLDFTSKLDSVHQEINNLKIKLEDKDFYDKIIKKSKKKLNAGISMDGLTLR